MNLSLYLSDIPFAKVHQSSDGSTDKNETLGAEYAVDGKVDGSLWSLTKNESNSWWMGKLKHKTVDCLYIERTRHPAVRAEDFAALQAAGLNTVDVYVPWNLHEPRRGEFDFGDGGSQFSPFLNITRSCHRARVELCTAPCAGFSR